MRNTITELFAEQVKLNGEAVALTDENRSLSWRGFDKLSDLIANGIPHGAKRVGIITDHGVEMIAAIFAALKTGAAYVPAEPSFPPERIKYMLADAGVDCVITNAKYADITEGFTQIFIERGMEVDYGCNPVQSEVKPNDLAYILYTSGSTGKPKGVAVEHANVCHYVRAFQNEFYPDKRDVMLQHSVCSFDIFVEEVFASLLSGAGLAIPDTETKNNLSDLMRFIDNNKVTIVSGFPYLLNEINKLSVLPKSLRLLISGGDVLRYSYVDKLLDKITVYNTYGPSETTVCVSYFKCSKNSFLKDGTFPVGKPVLGCEIAILDNNLQPVNYGETGEICIFGDGIARGYIGNILKESEVFTHTKDGRKVYRSGDMGYFLSDGNIAFLHRKDSQIMIYGKRVEPMEVENVLLQCSGVRQGCVRAFKDENGLPYMTAYIVTGKKTSLADIKQTMRSKLADFMIPEFFVKMNDITLNANGKIDEKSLPEVLKTGAI